MNWGFIGVCLAIIGFLGWRIVQRVRLLNQRIEALREEQERNPLDPFSAWMELWRIIDKR
ncbi:MAG: hypothetical protein C4337_05545 [Armatimonadota bacterium]